MCESPARAMEGSSSRHPYSTLNSTWRDRLASRSPSYEPPSAQKANPTKNTLKQNPPKVQTSALCKFYSVVSNKNIATSLVSVACERPTDTCKTPACYGSTPTHWICCGRPMSAMFFHDILSNGRFFNGFGSSGPLFTDPLSNGTLS